MREQRKCGVAWDSAQPLSCPAGRLLPQALRHEVLCVVVGRVYGVFEENSRDHADHREDNYLKRTTTSIP